MCKHIRNQLIYESIADFKRVGSNSAIKKNHLANYRLQEMGKYSNFRIFLNYILTQFFGATHLETSHLWVVLQRKEVEIGRIVWKENTQWIN